MRWLRGRAQAAGARLLTGHSFHSLGGSPGRVRVQLQHRGQVHRLQARLVIGADGARSRVARSAGLDRNRRLMLGTERRYLAPPSDDPSFLCVYDQRIAPGHFGWAVPCGERLLVGALGERGRFRPPTALQRLEARLCPHLDLGPLESRGRRGGVAPAGGPLRRCWDRRALLVGDAAGLCGAFGRKRC